jgi:hypothetical protein
MALKYEKAFRAALPKSIFSDLTSDSTRWSPFGWNLYLGGSSLESKIHFLFLQRRDF